MNDTNPLGVPAHRHRNPDGSEGGWVADTARVDPKAYVGRDAWVYGDAQVYGDARAYGNAQVYGNAWVYGDAQVYDARHVLTVGPVGSENQTATLYRTETGHGIAIGCWNDPNATLDDLKAEVMRRCPERWPEYREIRRVLRRRVAEWTAEIGDKA